MKPGLKIFKEFLPVLLPAGSDLPRVGAVDSDPQVEAEAEVVPALQEVEVEPGPVVAGADKKSVGHRR